MLASTFFRIVAIAVLVSYTFGSTLLTAKDGTPSAAIVQNAVTSVSPASPVTKAKTGKARNVILFIGDGMGPQQLGLLYAYSRYAPGSKVPHRVAAIEQMAIDGELGMVRTDPTA